MIIWGMCRKHLVLGSICAGRTHLYWYVRYDKMVLRPKELKLKRFEHENIDAPGCLNGLHEINDYGSSGSIGQ